MKTLVVYDSNYGNTKKIAEVIAKEIGGKAVNLAELTTREIEEVEFLVVGSPINGWRPTAKTIDFLGRTNLSGKKTAAFDTRMKVWYSGDAVKKMVKDLKKAGATVVGSEVFYVKDQEGPITEGEVEKAAEWAKKLV